MDFFIVPKIRHRFDWLSSFTGFHRVWRVRLGFTGFYWLSRGFTGSNQVFTEFYWVLPISIGFYGVLPSFTWFYWVFHGVTVLLCFIIGFFRSKELLLRTCLRADESVRTERHRQR